MKRWQVGWWTADRRMSGTMNNLREWEVEAAQGRARRLAGEGGGVVWRLQPSSVSEFAGFREDETPGEGPGVAPEFS